MQTKIKRAGFLEQRFDTGEIGVNYVAGPDNGSALVLIPAQMGTWESYEPVLPPLSRQFQVYAVDLRGHGKSDWTTGDYSWESVGRDMSAFLERVVQRPAIISGNSSGGIIALWCAAHLPEFVSAIVLEDAPVFSVEMPRFRDRDRYRQGQPRHPPVSPQGICQRNPGLCCGNRCRIAPTRTRQHAVFVCDTLPVKRRPP